MSETEKQVLEDVIEAVSRLNVALQGEILGGIAEAHTINKLLIEALDKLREPTP